MRWGIDFGQKNGIEIVTLEVSEENRRAMAFFQTFGFERTGRVPALVKTGSDTSILWRRFLICARHEKIPKKRIRGESRDRQIGSAVFVKKTSAFHWVPA
ncbi:RimJ/RimL family protein N-acetyltransferase [Peptoniphilus ivorii]|nr:RimJ/RimL family protein N-acetyltransferase [Peptoniphilus ivorii]